MATIVIPVRSDLPAYKFRISLDQTIYVLDFGYNTRADQWYMSIFDQAETLLVGDIPIQVNVPLTDQYIRKGMPPGRFVAVDETGKNRNPSISNLGSEIKLFYQEAESV